MTNKSPDIMTAGFSYGFNGPCDSRAWERSGLGMILLKPDATGNRHMCEQIVDYVACRLRLDGAPLVMQGMGLQKLRPEHIPLIYPEQGVAKYLEYITAHLCFGGLVMPIIVTHPDACQALNGIKGSVGTGDGIRGEFLSYKPISGEDIAMWENGMFPPDETHYIGSQLFAANLVHVPDTVGEVWRIIDLMRLRTKLKNAYEI